MTLRQQIEQLRADLESSRRNEKFLRGCVEAVQKKLAATRNAWSRPHVKDVEYMRQFEEQNEDPDLYDVFNCHLYSFRRADDDGTTNTVLSSAWCEIPNPNQNGAKP